jgi:hypothetical protein
VKARKRRDDPASVMCSSSRVRARQIGVPFKLVPDDIRAVWPADGRCPVLGMPLQAGKGKLQDASPTLDRLNNQWGYVRGNIAVISYRANRAKSSCTAAEHESIAVWMRGQGLA